MKTLNRIAATTAIATGLMGLALTGQAADRVSPDTTARQMPTVQLAANEDSDGYVEKAKREMTEWKNKVVEFGNDAKKKGKEVSKEAGDKLNEAWDEVEDSWGELKKASKEAGKDGWEKAKDAYETSKRKLQKAWDDVSS